MAAWMFQHSGTSRTHERPLGQTELGFYWDSKFNGTADTLQHAIVEMIDPQNQYIFSVENVSRTWIELKQQYPLLGAHVTKQKEGEGMVFVVAEDRLGTCGPGEISFQRTSSLTEVQELVDSMVNGERSLSDRLLARIVILARTDQPNHIHVLIHVTHCITDGIGNATLLREFLDILSSKPTSVKWDLQERLALALASEDLVPGAQLNRARRRWHWAIGRTLASIRLEKFTVHNLR